MDYEEMSKAYQSAKKIQDSVNQYPNGWSKEKVSPINTYSSYKQYLSINPQPETPSTPTEYDYSIVKMPDGGYVVARSKRLGSLDYDFVCSCASHWEARQIVKALSE